MLSGGRARHGLAFLTYLVAALYLTAPVLGEFSSRFIGGDAGDAHEMARHVWWYKTALQNGDDVFHHSLLGYPTGFRAAQLWVNPLQFFPMWLFAFFLPLPAAYNSALLLTLALNGWAMRVLALQKIGSPSGLPAFFAGLVYMILPIMQGHLFEGHPGLLAQWTLPLFILFLFDFADNGKSRRFVLALLFMLLTAMGNSLQSIYVIAPLMIMFLLARMSRRDHVGAARVLSVAVAGFCLLQLFVSPVLGDVMANQQFVAAGGYVRYSLDLLSPVSPSFANPFWQDIARHSPQVIGTSLGGGAAYLGLLGGGLALLGALNRRETRWWLLVAFVAWLLALGAPPQGKWRCSLHLYRRLRDGGAAALRPLHQSADIRVSAHARPFHVPVRRHVFAAGGLRHCRLLLQPIGAAPKQPAATGHCGIARHGAD